MAKLTKKIIWALDYLENDKTLANVNKTTGAFVAELEAQGFTVLPVHILSLNRFQARLRLGEVLSWKQYLTQSRENLNKYLNSLGFKKFQKAQIIENEAFGMRSEIDALKKFLKKSKAAAVVVSTHARKGVSRLFVGSFAETLVLDSSNVPVISVNPNAKIQKNLGKILYPTDLSPQDKKSLQGALQWAKALKSDLCLYHKQSPFVIPHFHSSQVLKNDPYKYYDELLDTQKKKVREKILEWGDFARAMGVDTRNVISSSKKELSDQLCSFAKKENCGMIYINSKSSSLETKFIGSLSRDVIRKSEIPVMVIR